MAYKRKAVYTGPDLGTMLRVVDRDGHACVRCGVAIRGERGRDWSLHHRRARGMGGTSDPDVNSPANLLSLCGSGTTGCHGHVEANRAEARDNGWLLWQNSDPASVAVLVARQSRWVYLNADAEYLDAPPREAA